MSKYPNLPSTDASALTRKDFATDQDVRWCPGCGDYSILAQVQRTLPELGIPREDYVFISGIGCSSRFPYYMDTYGMHSIHGRAPAVASGVKALRPELNVWVITGDGDALSIGGNHLMHALRRNIGLKIILFNNRIYGLTKGQYSPTSEQGKTTKSTPMGSIDYPFNPVGVALGAEATFVARAVDVDARHLQSMIQRMAAHEGTALLEVYQNCNIFNDGAYAYLSDRRTKVEHELKLEHGKPLRFGPKNEKGIMLDRSMRPIVVEVEDVGEDALLVHDETNPTLSYLLSQLLHPDFPTPVGVFRCVERPSYERMMSAQVDEAKRRKPGAKVQQAIEAAHIWTVE
ncbi:MAG: 2-oxoacid:ferredoxin oxidoreductase subunit beta [Myxococcales bacterium]|nr:2-oxoacid:ferredoxin oxidoreductase subunit beta [Myxococcales bacterium]MCB9536026.1 2-oxoacid:ferredoxin oxidoreductase subunit beta [Myxococcales bacterium]